MAGALTAIKTERREAWCFVLLLLLPLLAYARLATAGFIWDDDTMLTANPLVQAGDGLRRIWFTTQETDYWPVTFSSFWVEWRIWGAWAPGYHLTNVLLHLGTGLLLWRILLRLAVPGAFFAALWFALHPLNVESVAWIAQRKNLLAMVFFLASIRWFIAAEAGSKRGYWLSLIACLLALLSKGSAVPLPLILLGLILWRRRPTWTDAARLAPFFAVAALLAGVNLWFAHRGGGEVIRAIGWPARLAGAGGAVWFYLGKIFWPAGLCFIYPGWMVPPVHPIWWWGLAAALLLTALLGLNRNRGLRPELAAWLYFGAMLLPVLGLTDVYFMQYSLVADHYAHLALIGAVAWAASRFAQFEWPAGIAWSLAVGLGLLTFLQTAVYRDNFTLYRSVLARNPDSWLAHNNLAVAELGQPGHLPDAIAEFQTALRLKPDLAEAHNDLGSAWSAQPGHWKDAVAEYRAALRLKPDYAGAHINLGNAWSAVPDHWSEAVDEYRAALRLVPDSVPAHKGLAAVWAKMPGRSDEAAAEYRAALRLKPDDASAHNNLGAVWSGLPGHAEAAIAEYQAALRLDPGYAEAHYNLGLDWARTPGRSNDAIAQFEAALRLRPGYAEAHNALGSVWSRTPDRLADAIAQYQAALRLRPDYAEAHYNLGNAWSRMSGRRDDAVAEYEAALRLKPDYAAAHNNLGNAWLRMPGHLPEAIDQFEAALRLQPNSAAIRSNLAVARRMLAGIRAVQP